MDVDVAVTEFRARLSHWLDRARNGDEVVVTDRGVPVARVLGIDGAATIESLQQQGIVARPTRQDRPTATGHPRPRSRRPLSDLVSEQRR